MTEAGIKRILASLALNDEQLDEAAKREEYHTKELAGVIEERQALRESRAPLEALLARAGVSYTPRRDAKAASSSEPATRETMEKHDGLKGFSERQVLDILPAYPGLLSTAEVTAALGLSRQDTRNVSSNLNRLAVKEVVRRVKDGGRASWGLPQTIANTAQLDLAYLGHIPKSQGQENVAPSIVHDPAYPLSGTIVEKVLYCVRSGVPQPTGRKVYDYMKSIEPNINKNSVYPTISDLIKRKRLWRTGLLGAGGESILRITV
ncbi:MAG: hypothetical protein JWQ98_1046 [Chlorobi bacterium]|nr:hypothetical protein [Chlorobiota bacterium]